MTTPVQMIVRKGNREGRIFVMGGKQGLGVCIFVWRTGGRGVCEIIVCVTSQ